MATPSDEAVGIDQLLPRPSLRTVLLRVTLALCGVAALAQAAVVAKARPQDLITGV
jgi:uncharacterized membrane protein YadS